MAHSAPAEFNLSTSIRPRGFLSRARKVQPAYLDSLGIVNGRIRRGIGRTRGRERSQSDDIPKSRRIPRRWCAICEISCRLVRRVRLCMRSRRSFTCYVSLPPLLSSLVPSCSFTHSFTRSLTLAACLSPSFFDVILPCYYLYHRSRSAVREVAEKRDRDKQRSRKEVSRACNEANVLSLLYRSLH